MNLLDDQVRLVCFPHCSNVVGDINPVVEITALAHGAGAFVCVDEICAGLQKQCLTQKAKNVVAEQLSMLSPHSPLLHLHPHPHPRQS